MHVPYGASTVQPMPQPQHLVVAQAVLCRPPPVDDWRTGLFGCFQDCSICLMGSCFTPCLYGVNTGRVNGAECCGPCLLYTLLPCCTCLFAGRARQSIRVKYNLHEKPCSDCCVHCWCSPCGVCQEARELKLRG